MSTKGLQIFARMVKVDEAKRQVTGIIADETKDASGEVFDFTKSKPHFVAWSDTVAKASGGKSVGNVRGQHGAVVAGRLEELNFDDVAKSITVTADIVDDNEWQKVMKGCYTGFSIGGKYGEKWDDPVAKAKRYVAIPTEVSLVDLGCNPNATFTVVKSDGSSELRKYASAADPGAGNIAAIVPLTASVAAPAVDASKVALLKTELALVDAAKQPELHKYMTEVLAAAETELAKSVVVKMCPKRDAYAKALAKAAETRPEVQAMVKAAATQIKENPEALLKGLYTVGRLSEMLSTLGWISDDVAFEAIQEGDGSTVPGQINGVLRTLGRALIDLVTEEVAEFLADHSSGELATAVKVDDLRKALGADLQKSIADALSPITEAMNKATEVTNKNFGELTKRLEAHEEVIRKFAAQPRQEPQRAAGLRVVGKGEEIAEATDAVEKKVEPVMGSDGKEDAATTMIKAVHAGGGKPLMKGL